MKYLPLRKIVANMVMLAALALTLVGCSAGEHKPGDASTYKVGEISFKMQYAPSASFISDDPDISGSAMAPNLPRDIAVDRPFWIAETEVTNDLWAEVYAWATADERGAEKYQFQSRRSGRSRQAYLTSQHPVTDVTWSDAMVWCNALTEYHNAHNRRKLGCVYIKDGEPLRNARDGAAWDAVVPDESAKGFRLPTSAEWQLAARYEDGLNWTPGDHISGDRSGPCCPEHAGDLSRVFREYGWYKGNSNGSTQPVGKKLPNALGVYDMSGNVWEWCFDWYPGFIGKYRILRGGGWVNIDSALQIGNVSFGYIDLASEGLGFRLAMTE